MKLDHFPTPHTKINSKWIKDLNVRPEIIKLLEENIGRTLWYKSQQDPLWPTSQSNGNKSKIIKWDLIKLKSFCTTKETINKVKRQPSEWEKIIVNEATCSYWLKSVMVQLRQITIHMHILKNAVIPNIEGLLCDKHSVYALYLLPDIILMIILTLMPLSSSFYIWGN